MRVLGIDPGTHRIGWGIIEGDAAEHRAVAYGCIELDPHAEETEYLLTLNEKLKEIIKTFKPDKSGVEKIFFQKNRKTAISVAKASGVIQLTLSKLKVPFIELSPNTIKSAVTGSGRADKKMMESMVTMLLNLDEAPDLDDTSDALAVAITTITRHDELI